MSIKFDICNDLAIAVVEKLKKQKIDDNIINYVAENISIILTLYQQDINPQQIINKPRKYRRRKNAITEEQTISNKE